MATIALDIGGTKIASAIFLPDGSMLFNRKRLLKGRTGHEVGKLAAEILAKLLTVAREAVSRLTVSVYVFPALSIRRRDVYGLEHPRLGKLPATRSTPYRNGTGYRNLHRQRPYLLYVWRNVAGAAKDCHSAVFIAVGTGIGAGIIIDGHVLHGASDIIGATGWMAPQPPYKEEYDACGCFLNIMPREMVSEPECGMQSVQIKLIRDAYVKTYLPHFRL